MKNLYLQVGQKIRLFRRQASMTQAQLAEKAGLSDNFVGLIERGEGHPTLDTMGKLAEVLKVRMGEFFAGDDEQSQSTAQVLKELEYLLKHRNPKDAQLLLTIGKKIFERFSDGK
jgi:transcriptional regulator with XRE-family HTH domain